MAIVAILVGLAAAILVVMIVRHTSHDDSDPLEQRQDPELDYDQEQDHEPDPKPDPIPDRSLEQQIRQTVHNSYRNPPERDDPDPMPRRSLSSLGRDAPVLDPPLRQSLGRGPSLAEPAPRQSPGRSEQVAEPAPRQSGRSEQMAEPAPRQSLGREQVAEPAPRRSPGRDDRLAEATRQYLRRNEQGAETATRRSQPPSSSPGAASPLTSLDLSDFDNAAGHHRDLRSLLDKIASAGSFAAVFVSDDEGRPLAFTRTQKNLERLAATSTRLMSVATLACNEGPGPLSIMLRDTSGMTMLCRIFKAHGQDLSLTVIGENMLLTPLTLDQAVNKIVSVLTSESEVS